MVLFVVSVRTDDMNQHFEDARYYLKRAGETAKAGIAEELEPIRERLQELVGDEEPDAGRLQEVQEELTELQERAEGRPRRPPRMPATRSPGTAGSRKRSC
jgi:septation ring formation regulator EzrA